MVDVIHSDAASFRVSAVLLRSETRSQKHLRLSRSSVTNEMLNKLLIILITAISCIGLSLEPDQNKQSKSRQELTETSHIGLVCVIY